MEERSAPLLAFNEQLRHYRQRIGLSQADLAERAGLAASAISALERGVRTRPYPHTTRQLADALELNEAERAAFLTAAPLSPTHPHRRSSARAKQRLAAIPATPLTPLIGRAADLTSLRARIEQPGFGRLTMLTGMAGIGKTRLALQLAVELGTAFTDGVWFVELAPVDDPADVVQVVAGTLGLRDVPNEQAIDRMITFLRPRHALLILDNCEHLTDTCADLAHRLLSGCPSLRMIATSREPFRITGEQVWRLRPLQVPARDSTVATEHLAQVAAVQLFVERAQAVAIQFRLTAENAAAVADICIQLEGIPLAIELAAALVRVLKVEQIAERLTNALGVLSSNNRDMPSRQQTLTAALDWSYALLDEPERRLLERLAVFRGGANLESVEAICADDDLPAADILVLIAQLVDKSLVQMEDDGPVARYRLLEPVRLYAEQHLALDDESGAVATRHASAFVALAERAAPELRGPRQIRWFQQFDREQDNFRTALRRLAELSHATDGVRLTVALAPFWSARGHLSEGRRWISTMLGLPSANPIPLPLRVAALMRSGELAQWQAALDEALELFTACNELATQMNDQRAVSEALIWIGIVKRRQGDLIAARARLESGMAIARKLADEPAYAFGLLNLGVTVIWDDDLASGTAMLDECLAIFRALGDTRSIAMACTMCAGAANWSHDHRRAAVLFREGLAKLVTVGDQVFALNSLRMIASFVADGQPDVAAQLLGATDMLRETLNSPIDILSTKTDTATMTTIREQRSNEQIALAISRGQMLAIDQAQAMAGAALDLLLDTLKNTEHAISQPRRNGGDAA